MHWNVRRMRNHPVHDRLGYVLLWAMVALATGLAGLLAKVIYDSI